jgi:hypothetical protein
MAKQIQDTPNEDVLEAQDKFLALRKLDGNIVHLNADDLAEALKLLLTKPAFDSSYLDFGGAGDGIWWEEIARTTLESVGDTITVDNIPEREYLKIIVNTPNSGQISQTLRFNNDSGSNYASSLATAGGATSASVNQTSVVVTGVATYPMHFELEIFNPQSREKVGYLRRFHQNTAGAGNAPTQMEGVLKWVNTSAKINRVDVINAGTGDFAIGAEVIILGHD